MQSHNDDVGHRRSRAARGCPVTAPVWPHPSHHRPRAAADPGAAVPATVWVPPADATGSAWRAWVYQRVRAAFLAPTGRWWDMTGVLRDLACHPTPPTPATPFWAALVDDDAASTAQQLTASPTAAPAAPAAHDPSPPDRPSAPTRRGPAPSTPRRAVDVVFADLTAPPLAPDLGPDGRLGMLAARALRGGGILAVLTSRTPVLGGRLVDPTGPVVASAQNADLLYLQHIVVPTGPLRPPVPTGALTDTHPARPAHARPAHAQPDHAQPDHAQPDHAHTGGPRTSGGVHARGHLAAIGHVDLLVFAQPRKRGGVEELTDPVGPVCPVEESVPAHPHDEPVGGGVG